MDGNCKFVPSLVFSSSVAVSCWWQERHLVFKKISLHSRRFSPRKTLWSTSLIWDAAEKSASKTKSESLTAVIIMYSCCTVCRRVSFWRMHWWFRGLCRPVSSHSSRFRHHRTATCRNSRTRWTECRVAVLHLLLTQDVNVQIWTSVVKILGAFQC